MLAGRGLPFVRRDEYIGRCFTVEYFETFLSSYIYEVHDPSIDPSRVWEGRVDTYKLLSLPLSEQLKYLAEVESTKKADPN